MQSKKNLEKELRALRIPFIKVDGGYILWPESEWCRDKVRSKRECWRIVNKTRNENKPSWKGYCQRLQNKRIRKETPNEKPVYKPDRWMWD